MTAPLDIRFAPVEGIICASLRTQLSAWTGLVIQQKRPDPHVTRMVTVRNDSGPADSVVKRLRIGVNVWAGSWDDAANLAADVEKACRKLPVLLAGNPIKQTTTFSGPYEIDDDPVETVGNVNLTHFYLTFTCAIKGS